MTAAVVPTPERNRLGIAALVLVLIAIALPILVFIVAAVAASIEGAEGDAVGWNILGGFIIAGVSVTAFAPIAIVALVLGIVAVTRKGKRKVQAVIAIILSVGPGLAIFGLPAAIDSMF
ncbi:MAG: hypothetical protein ABI566_06755 [Pseudolysinimonas sp.]